MAEESPTEETEAVLAQAEREFDETCLLLKEAFERRLQREREKHDATWQKKEAEILTALETALEQARSAVDLKLQDREPSGDPELDMIRATYWPTLKAQREAQAKLVAAREAGVEAGKVHKDVVPVRVMGVLDPALLTSVGMTAEEISSLQDRLTHPEFYPIHVVVEGDDVREDVDRAHPELVALRFEFGEVVVDEVLRCFRELCDWNPSGRYSVSVPWDDDHELEPAEIIKRLAARRQPPPARRRAARRPFEDDLGLFNAAQARPVSHRRQPPARSYPRLDLVDHPVRMGAPTSSNVQAPPPAQPPAWVRAPRAFSSFFWGNAASPPAPAAPIAAAPAPSAPAS